ncbi:MAG: tyrosine-type recombinase/integrase [Microthrixaceae bacterium]
MENCDMAWLELHRTGTYHIVFRFGGAKFRRSLKTSDEREAKGRLARLDDNIRLVERGLMALPEHGDVAAFLLSNGQFNGKPKLAPRLTLAQLIDRYCEVLPVDALEPESLRVVRLHIRHFVRILGARKYLGELLPADLQKYVLRRSAEPGKHGKRVSVGTIRKELATLNTLWNWATQQNYVAGPLPKMGLKFPKLDEHSPFQTYSQIARQVDRGRLTATEEAELWDCLYLSSAEIDSLLLVVEDRSTYQFLHPMVLMAAHTGARRSELCRSRESDYDFEAETILIREKKRAKGRRTTRMVPMTARLKRALETWFAEKEASPFAFPAEHQVERVRRPRFEEGCVSPDQASHHLERILAGTQWEKIRGWHIFRHSFISNCASCGVDQRMIDSWVGHQTDAMRRRYTHLFPHAQHAALAGVFAEPAIAS